MPNCLASEQSPYLRQHAENPVDWLPFGKNAFAEAARLDRPILLSIGYSACHWCHVMAHESFENPATAKLMNDRFVNIKVDREELPDVDQIYQRALALQGESGGWPLTMFLTPGGTPYFGGTYFPPEDRHGRPGFPRILVALSDAWQKDRESILQHAAKYSDGLAHLAARELDGGNASALTDAALDAAIDGLLGRVDTEHAGFGGAPKFPNASALRLLLRGARRRRRQGLDGAPLETAFLHALTAMAEGGIYDQLGGGFARYATDRVWLVPHFEKMLYDNGQLLRLYAEGYQRTRDPLYARVLRETAAFLERELRAPEGGLYTALDADSEGVEGLFYAWTWAELERLLTTDELALVERCWGARREGNWKDPHGHGPELANVLSVVLRGHEDALAPVRDKLFAARARRVRPATDDKILSGMNGLALTGLAEAARVLADPVILDGARRTAEFLLTSLRADDGRMRRTWKAGVARLPGTLDDHAFVAEGLVALYEATFEPRWFDAAVTLLRRAVALFWDEPQAAFYVTAPDEDELPTLIERPLSGHDGAIPSGASVVAELLLVVGEATKDDAMTGVARKLLERRASGALVQPFAYAQLLGAMDTLLEGPTQIVVTGPDANALERAVATVFVPGRLIVKKEGAPGALASLVAGKGDAEAAVFVCRGSHCEAPERDPARLAVTLTS